MIHLKKIDCYNFAKLLRLDVREDQKEFVASNAFSMAQAYVAPECRPLAVYDDTTPVGFVMYALDEDDREYWIYRVMIDQARQGQGLGKAAMRLLIDRIRAEAPERRKIYISFEPENTVARALYVSLGFVPDGRVVDGETVYRLDLASAVPGAIVYNETRKDLPCDALYRLFLKAGWAKPDEDPKQIARFNAPFLRSAYVASAWDGETLVGCARLIGDETVRCVLEDLVIDPAYRGRGIGRELLTRCLAKYPDSECLVTSAPGAVGFYRKLGLETIAECPDGAVFLRRPSKYF